MITDIRQAAKIIQAGGVVAFPTETVYGLGADAQNEEACLKIFAIKERPLINPLIVHVASFEQALTIGEFNEAACKLKDFWPGPLSIIVPLKENHKIAKNVLAGLSSIALRVPAHPLALELIKQANCPIAAPSANPSGYISATKHEHVARDFADKDIFILAAEDNCRYGLESTIIDTTSAQPTILRLGFITPQAISQVLGEEVEMGTTLQVKAPGMLEQHYSPVTSLRMNATELAKGEITLNFGNSSLQGIYSLNLSPKGDLTESAVNLYSYLRLLDDYAILHNIHSIAVAPVPNEHIGLAINDRLKRAAY